MKQYIWKGIKTSLVSILHLKATNKIEKSLSIPIPRLRMRLWASKRVKSNPKLRNSGLKMRLLASKNNTNSNLDTETCTGSAQKNTIQRTMQKQWPETIYAPTL